MRPKYNLEERILKTIQENNLIEEGDKLVVGVSGGPDSICMLNALINIYKNDEEGVSPMAKNCQKGPSPVAIVVAHVNHMIREEAAGDERYVEEFCAQKNIDFYSKSIDVQKFANNNKIGVEEAGRNARYDFFDEVLEKTGANKIAIAHNMNDKIETMIMNAMRGTGISGLKGIEAKRGRYIRPLIDCKRDEIEAYCQENNLNPRIDKTNFENDYTRNKTRNIVIPYIKKEFNPNIIETLNRLSELVFEEEDYIDKQVDKAYGNLLLEESSNQIVLDLKKFNCQEKVIKSRLVLYNITRLFGTSKGIEKIHIEDIIKLCGNNVGNKYLTPNKKIKVLVKNHKIYFIKQI